MKLVIFQIVGDTAITVVATPHLYRDAGFAKKTPKSGPVCTADCRLPQPDPVGTGQWPSAETL